MWKMAPARQNTLLIDGFILFTCALCWYLCTQKATTVVNQENELNLQKDQERGNMTSAISSCVATCLVTQNLSAWVEEHVILNKGSISVSGSSSNSNASFYLSYYSELIKEAILLAIGTVLGFAVAIGLLRWQTEVAGITAAASSPIKPVFTIPKSHMHLNRATSVKSAPGSPTIVQNNNNNGTSTTVVQRSVSTLPRETTC